MPVVIRAATVLSTALAAIVALGCGGEKEAEAAGCVLAYLAADATTAEVAEVKDALEEEPVARNVEFVSREEALERMRQRFPELTDNLAENPLPSGFRVEAAKGADLTRIVIRLRDFPQVESASTSARPCELAEQTS